MSKPTVIERLLDATVVRIACGANHVAMLTGDPAAERQRVAARLEGVEACIRGVSLSSATGAPSMSAKSSTPYITRPAAQQRHAPGRGPAFGRDATCVVDDGSLRSGSRHGHASRGHTHPLRRGARREAMPSAWITERLSVFFQESAAHAVRRALVAWQMNAAYLAGLAAAGETHSRSDAAWAHARAEKVTLVRQLDEQKQRLSHASLVLALDSAAIPAPSPYPLASAKESAMTDAASAKKREEPTVLRGDGTSDVSCASLIDADAARRELDAAVEV